MRYNEDDTKEVFSAVSDAVNSVSVNSEVLMEEIDNEHNALQRMFFHEFLKPSIIALAETEYVDARNRQTRDDARKIVGLMGWD